MPELSALLFDLDGTLVDTAEANFAAYAAALAEAGIGLTREAFDHASTGRRWREFLPGLIGTASVDPAKVAARKREIYPVLVSSTRVNAALVDLARSMRSRLKLAVVTSASRSSAKAVLAAHNLEALFTAVVTGDDVTRPKPAPAPYLLAATRLEVEPKRCLALEDSEAGLASARAAGMHVVRVAFPGG